MDGSNFLCGIGFSHFSCELQTTMAPTPNRRRVSNPLELLELAAGKLMGEDSSDDDDLHNASHSTISEKQRTNRTVRRASSYVASTAARQSNFRRSSFSLFDFHNESFSESSDDTNNFPTRSNDLRHVDQSINLMDAETANYKAPRSDYIFAMNHSSEEEESSDDEKEVANVVAMSRRSSFALIQDGLTALRQGALPRRNSLPLVDLMDDSDVEMSKVGNQKRQRGQGQAPKHHSMSFLTEMEDPVEETAFVDKDRSSSSDSSESSSSSSNHSWADHLMQLQESKLWRSIGWAFLLGILVGTTALTIMYWNHLPLAKALRGTEVAESTNPAVMSPPPETAVATTTAMATAVTMTVCIRTC